MNHFRLSIRLAVAVAIAVSAAACSDPAQEPDRTAGPVLELRPNGVGAVDLDQPPGPVLEELNSFFGEPDVDSGWISADSPLYGTCPGTALRAAGWGSFYAFFVADEPVAAGFEDSSGRLYSFSYGYDFSRNEGATDPRNLNLATPDGVRLGTTRSELQDLYGATLSEEYNEIADTWAWSAATEGGELRGLLSGPTDTDTVVVIETARGCEISD